MNQTFKNHPNLKEYFETSDGQKFYSLNAAELHAKSLKDRKIGHEERPFEGEETGADKSGSDKGLGFEELGAALEKLKVEKIPKSKASRQAMLDKLTVDAQKAEEAKLAEEAKAIEEAKNASSNTNQSN